MYHFYVLDCWEKTTESIFSSQVPNKIPLNSASFALWYLIVALLILEIFPKNIRQSYMDHPVDVFLSSVRDNF